MACVPHRPSPYFLYLFSSPVYPPISDVNVFAVGKALGLVQLFFFRQAFGLDVRRSPSPLLVMNELKFCTVSVITYDCPHLSFPLDSLFP